MNAPIAPSDDDRRKRIRAAGLRVTLPRVAVLRELDRAATPLSHSDLVGALTSHGLDRATLYRNLTDLADSGLVSRRDLGDHVWRFELKREQDHGGEHPHFVCNDCGDVVCVPLGSVKLEVQKKAPRVLRRQPLEVQLKGTCDRCAAG